MSERRVRGRAAQAAGVGAEAAAAAALEAAGWVVLARRLRNAAGEIDLVAATADVLAFVEVKARATLADAAEALGPRQRGRLLAAAEAALAARPDWARESVRFDVVLVDSAGRVRRIADAFRAEG